MNNNMIFNNEKTSDEDNDLYNTFTQMLPEYHEILEFLMLCFNLVLMITVFVLGMRMAHQDIGEEVNTDDPPEEYLDENFKLDDPIPTNDEAGPDTDGSY